MQGVRSDRAAGVCTALALTGATCFSLPSGRVAGCEKPLLRPLSGRPHPQLRRRGHALPVLLPTMRQHGLSRGLAREGKPSRALFLPGERRVIRGSEWTQPHCIKYSVSRRFLGLIGRARWLAMTEDARKVLANEHKREVLRKSITAGLREFWSNEEAS